MNKYALLILLNTPIACIGLFNVFLTYQLKRIRRGQMVIRLLFWLFILAGIWFVKPLTDLLRSRSLTDSPALSIYDVLLVTGLVISFLLITRAYAKIGKIESQFTEVHEKLSIVVSEPTYKLKPKQKSSPKLSSNSLPKY